MGQLGLVWGSASASPLGKMWDNGKEERGSLQLLKKYTLIPIFLHSGGRLGFCSLGEPNQGLQREAEKRLQEGCDVLFRAAQTGPRCPTWLSLHGSPNLHMWGTCGAPQLPGAWSPPPSTTDGPLRLGGFRPGVRCNHLDYCRAHQEVFRVLQTLCCDPNKRHCWRKAAAVVPLQDCLHQDKVYLQNFA